jgi:membrane protease YdiL (CAAX protease family)
MEGMKSIYRSNLFMLAIIVSQIAGAIFLSGILQQIFTNSQFLVATQVLFLFVPVLIYFLITGLPIKQTLKLNKLSVLDILIVIAIAVLSQPIASFFASISGLFFEDNVTPVLKELGNISYFKQLGIIALTPAICEELTMRGVVLAGYDKVSRGKAALATGLFFGILHLNPQQFLYAFVLGVIFAYLVRITNSIFSTILCHFTFNGIQVTLLYWMSNRNSEDLKEVSNAVNTSVSNQIASIGSTFVLAMAAAYIVVKLLRYLEKMHSRFSINYDNSHLNQNSFNKDMNISEGNNKDERIINLPFIGVIMVYFAFMALLWKIS